MGPPGINVHDWEVCHSKSQITVSSGYPDTFYQIVYVLFCKKHFNEINMECLKISFHLTFLFGY
jgi:hypothetical protein